MSRICDKGHHNNTIDALQELPASQKNEVRHVCAACAYEQGVKDGARMVRDSIVKAFAEITYKALPPWLR
jgi:hypothetical protein